MTNMKLAKPYFNKIACGEKTIEVRLYDKKRQALTVGEDIIFTDAECETRHIKAKICALYRFDSFSELFNSEHLAKCGFQGLSPNEACDIMHCFYSPADESKYGVLAIAIEIL